MEPILPGIVSATFKTEPAAVVLSHAAQNGLKVIEWSENAHLQPGDAPGARELRLQTETAGLRVAAYGSYYRLGEQADPGARFRQSLVSAQALGAPLIRVWAGTLPSAQADSAARCRLAAEAGLIGRQAAACGIRVAFEWHKNTLTDTNASALRLLQDADCDNLYCLWQPTVALTLQERCEGVRLLGDRLLNFHVYYWLQGTRRPLCEGKTEWLGYLAAFQGGAGHCALLEFVMNDAPEQFAADSKALLELLRHAGRG